MGKERKFKLPEMDISPEEDRIKETIRLAGRAFYEGQGDERLSYFEFLWFQGRFIKKRWWLLQAALLCLLWLLMAGGNGQGQIHREAAILIPAFAVVVIPELWKNVRSQAMEIESASYFTLRQVNCARLTLFAIVDLTLLSLFILSGAVVWHLTLLEIVTQFLVPFLSTCGIYLTIFCNRSLNSELLAVSLCLLWTAVWYFVVMDDGVYKTISLPLWMAAFVLSAAFVAAALCRIFKDSHQEWPVNARWPAL